MRSSAISFTASCERFQLGGIGPPVSRSPTQRRSSGGLFGGLSIIPARLPLSLHTDMNSVGDQPSSQPSPGFTRISPLRPRLAPLYRPAVPETLAIFVGISRYQQYLSRTRRYRISSLTHQHWSRPNSPFPPHRRRRARRDDVGLPPAYSSNGPASNVATPSAYSRTHISR